MRRTIYFADLTHCGTITNADTFPLGIGSIAATVAHRFLGLVSVELFKFPDDLNQALENDFPDILCLSNYAWNLNLSLAFARYVREHSPNTIIVMGGPNICITEAGREVFLVDHDYIDFYIKYEGEIAFCDLLSQLFDSNFEVNKIREKKIKVANLLYVEDNILIEGPDYRITDLSDIPSPYTTGLLDKFFAQGLRPLVEFSRGCPYSCTFCTDFHELRNRHVRRDLEYVEREITYIAERVAAASDLIIADLNFGMYKEDIEVAKIIRAAIDRYHWPKSITGSPGKSQPERVAEVVSIINGRDHGILKFAASMQSTNKDVLNLIKRKNLPLDRFNSLVSSPDHLSEFTEYFTELIIGLPGDTKEKHYQSLRDVVDKLGMNVVNVHQLALLKGAPLALPEQKLLYEFDERYRVLVGCIGTCQIGQSNISCAEIEEIVVASNSLSFDDWLDCRVMNLLIKIYIDRDYFVEIFGLVRRMGLSPLDLLEVLRTQVFNNYPELRELVQSFRAKTLEPLSEDFASLMEISSDQSFVDAHRTGELGGNELLMHRAMAYLECNEGLHDALYEAASIYLREMGRLSSLTSKYLNEAISFSKLRKFNPENYQRDLTGKFSFDFITAKSCNYQVLPEEVSIKNSKMRFFFNDVAKDEIDYAIKTWVLREGTRNSVSLHTASNKNIKAMFTKNAATRFNMGKFYHYSNLRVMNRSVEIAG